MTKQHPITPPPELVEQWLENTRSHDCIGAYPANYEQLICTQAARWGADQELEACLQWFSAFYWMQKDLEKFRTARRPKPPSLKEQALEALDEEHADMRIQNYKLIRSVLESLPE
jgi:hypothetical protein